MCALVDLTNQPRATDVEFARAMRWLNDPAPWTETLRGRPITISELIANGTLSSQAAATLQWTIERGASAFVAAGPGGAGKTTLANALLEFLPEDAAIYVTSGFRDQLAVPSVRPLYLLVNELSDHMWLYLSGRAAHRAFALLPSGVRIIGTLHARSGEEAARVMLREAAISSSELGAAFVMPVVTAWRTHQGIARAVQEIAFLSRQGEVHPLFDRNGAALEILPTGLQALAAWAVATPDQVRAEIASRASNL